MIGPLAPLCSVCGFDAIPAKECCGLTFCPTCFEQHECEGLLLPAGTTPNGMTMRPYQAAAVEGVYRELNLAKSTLVVLPTGCGKTIVFAEVTRQWPMGRVLVVAHRDELIWQAAKKIEQVTGEPCDIEMGEYFADRMTFEQRAKCVVTSVQTMSRKKRHSRFHPEEFGLVIIDEAHHGVGRTYRCVIEHFGQAKVLGVTATPDRADEKALGQIFDSVAFEYQLPDAIRDGWLVPIQQQFVFVESLDLSQIHTVANDLNQGELSRVMEEEKNLHGVVGPTIELAKAEQTIVFATSVEQAERMAEIANRHKPGCAEWICGDQIKTPKEVRRDTLKRFSERKFQFLFNCGVLLEGYDEPQIGVVAIARPTKSRSLYAQMVGRGTRALPGTIDGPPTPEARLAAIAASRKPSVLVLDFVGNSGEHKLVHCGDILGGTYDDETLAEAHKAVQAASSRGERTDMLQALSEAEERRRQEEMRKRQRLVAKARFQTKLVNPFEVWDVMPKREPGWHQGRKPSPKQLSYLEKIGVAEKELEKLSFCQASQIIDESIKRREAGLCSYKQAKILRRYGYAADVSFTDASQIIDRLAANGWRPLQTQETAT